MLTITNEERYVLDVKFEDEFKEYYVYVVKKLYGLIKTIYCRTSTARNDFYSYIKQIRNELKRSLAD